MTPTRPRQARLAFCNDPDFMTFAAHEDVHAFIQTSLGLPFTDSAYLIDLASEEEFAFFHGPELERGPHFERLVEYARQGRIAALHSVNVCIGDYPAAPSRSQIAFALSSLVELGIRIPIWTTHGSDRELANLGGATPVYQQGDHPASDAYALDLLLAAGVRWFWMDHHTTNVFGQFHDGAGLLQPEATRAGFSISTFRRFRGALPKAPDVHSFAWQLNEEHLRDLVEHHASVVIYQHWGCRRDPTGKPLRAASPVLPESTRLALEKLAEYAADGRIQVVRVQDLLHDLAGGAP